MDRICLELYHTRKKKTKKPPKRTGNQTYFLPLIGWRAELSVQVIQIGSESGKPCTLESHTLGNGLYLLSGYAIVILRKLCQRNIFSFFSPIRKKEGKDKDKRYRTDPPASGPRKRKKERSDKSPAKLATDRP